jgi:hypothetical protein
MMATLSKIASLLFRDFERLFFMREYTALAGRGQKTLAALTAILFLTFLALGFAVGSLANLQQKMENPYTNWVDLPISEGYISKRAGDIYDTYNLDETAALFNLRNTNGFSKYVIDFYPQGFLPYHLNAERNPLTLWGRTIEADETLLAEIINPEGANLIWATTDLTPETFDGCEIIVTQHLLEQLGYTDPASVEHLLIGDGEELLFVRLAAVVKELPSFCRFISSPRLYNILMAKTDGAKPCQSLIASNRVGSNNFFLLTEHKRTAITLDSLAKDYFLGKDVRVDSEQSIVCGALSFQTCTLSFLPYDAPPLDSVNSFIYWAQRSTPVSTYAAWECTPSVCGNLSFRDYHYLAFHFERLDAVRPFRNHLYEHFNIEIDLGQIEAKQNFALVSRLTFVISLILMAFAILNIVFFVNNLLRTHLFEVRSNLGTFQAFGLSNRFLINIYLKIIFTFLTFSAIIAFLLGVAIDFLEQIWQGPESRFDIFNIWILMAVVGLYAISILLSLRTIHQILGDTPGNLIYER